MLFTSELRDDVVLERTDDPALGPRDQGGDWPRVLMMHTSPRRGEEEGREGRVDGG